MLVQNDSPNHLLEKALSLFMRYGIRSVTMDDVAREAGMSKKTIYQQCGDRNGLVMATVRYMTASVSDKCKHISVNHSNPIDQLLEIGRYFHDLTRQINPNLFYEMSKYFPEAWTLLRKHRMEFVEDQVSANIEKGIEQGIYRDNFNKKIVIRLYLSLIDLILDEETFPKSVFTFKELHREIILYHLHAIVTPKGLKYLHTKQIIQ